LTQNNKQVWLSGNKLSSVTLTLMAILLTVTVAVVNKQFGTDIQTQQIIDTAQALQDQFGQLNSSIQSINDSLVKDLDAYFYANQKECSYLIGYASPYYTMQNGTTAILDYWNGNVTKVETFANGNLTTGGLIETKEVLWNTSIVLLNNVFVIQNYNGTYAMFSNAGAFSVPILNADPSAGLLTLTSPSGGNIWYNNGDDHLKYWNGTAIVTLPGIGGGGISYVLPPTYNLYNVGSTYYMEKYDGTTFSSTNGSKILQFAYDNLTAGRTSPEVIQGRGNWNCDSTVLATSYSMLKGPMKITLNTANIPLFAYENTQDGVSVWFEDLTLYGQSLTNTRGMYFYSNMTYTVADPSTEQRLVTVYNCKIGYFGNEGIWMGCNSSISYAGTFWVQDNFMAYNERTSSTCDLNITYATDGYVLDNEMAVAWFQRLSAFVINNNYFGGGNAGNLVDVTLQDCTGSLFQGNTVDKSYHDGIYIAGSNTANLNIEMNRISKCGYATNATYYGIHIDSSCGYNDSSIIQGNIIFKSSATNILKSGIYEGTTCGGNLINDNIIQASDYASDAGGYGIDSCAAGFSSVNTNIGTTHTH